MLKDSRLGDSPQAPSTRNIQFLENPEDAISNAGSDGSQEEEGEKVVYRGGWRMPYRSTVTKQSVPILTQSEVGWQRVAGSSTQVQREIFVQTSCFERTDDPKGYSLRLHVHQPDMNLSLSKDIRTRELATILLPLFRNSVSKPVARVIEDSAHLPDGDDEDEDDDLTNGIIQRSLKRFIKTGWAPRRVHLIKWLLERLRILENIQGELTLAIEPTPEEAHAWVESETQRRFTLLTGGKASLELKTECALMIQCQWRIKKAQDDIKVIQEDYQDKIDEERANMIQNAWKNHVGRKLLFKMGDMYRKKMEEQAAIMMQQQIRAKLARLHFRHTKDAHAREVDAAIMFQAAWRGRIATTEYKRLRKEYEYECLLKNSAIIIQSWFRRRKANQKVDSLRKERDVKIRQAEKELNKAMKQKELLDAKEKKDTDDQNKAETNAILNLQRVYRGSKERAVLAKWMKQKVYDHTRKCAVNRLAARWRGYSLRKTHNDKVTFALTNLRITRRRDSATLVQKNIRAALARSAFKFSRNEWSKSNAAAMLVQSTWRGHDSRVKSKYMLERAKIVDRLAKQLAKAAQDRWLMEQQAERLLEEERRRMKEMRREIENNQACLMVQSAWRGQIARKDFNKIRKEYDIQISHEKANQIQYAWRNRVGRNQLRRLKEAYDGQLQDSSAKICQQHIRGKLARMQYRVTKDEKSKEIAMAIRIQSNWRCSKERKNYAKILQEKWDAMEEKAALCIQCAWRSKRARRKVDVLIQAKYKALEESAAIMLQCAWRGHAARLEFHKRRQARLEQEKEDNRLAIEAAEEEVRRQERINKSKQEQEEKRKQMRKEAKEALDVDDDIRKNNKIDNDTKKRIKKEEEIKKNKDIAKREQDGRDARQKRKDDNKQREADRNKNAILAKKAEAAKKKAAQEAEEQILRPIKPKETTMKVYSGLWEMPCDLKREPWCEVVIKVLERHNPYRLRFEGKPKLMWYNEIENSSGQLLDLTRRAKYTVSAEQLQTVLLPAFDTEVMSPIANRKQRTRSGTSTFGGKRSAESAMMKWAQTGFSPLRERVIQWVLRRMRVGVNEKCLVFKMSEEMTESYQIDVTDKAAAKKRRQSSVKYAGKLTTTKR